MARNCEYHSFFLPKFLLAPQSPLNPLRQKPDRLTTYPCYYHFASTQNTKQKTRWELSSKEIWKSKTSETKEKKKTPHTTIQQTRKRHSYLFAPTTPPSLPPSSSMDSLHFSILCVSCVRCVSAVTVCLYFVFYFAAVAKYSVTSADFLFSASVGNWCSLVQSNDGSRVRESLWRDTSFYACFVFALLLQCSLIQGVRGCNPDQKRKKNPGAQAKTLLRKMMAWYAVFDREVQDNWKGKRWERNVRNGKIAKKQLEETTLNAEM